MSPACFQAAQMINNHTQIRPKAFHAPPMLPAAKAGPTILPVAGKPRRGVQGVRCSVSSAPPPAPSTDCGGGGGESVGFLERCFRGPSSSSSTDFGPVMKGQYGAFGAVTLEKGKLDMAQKQSVSSPEWNPEFHLLEPARYGYSRFQFRELRLVALFSQNTIGSSISIISAFLACLVREEQPLELPEDDSLAFDLRRARRIKYSE
ncbi:hypothetical protein CRG98_004605 [Punica granatum]|uniref:Uncharacterized protein n=1 Tax=Punica granatum TaxID=22663 RepID=A0A2I0L2I3_PUNGR|nr:hypothetical protein CRG98_004605 [Punica granatum]